MTIGLQTGMHTGLQTSRQRTVDVSDHAHYYVISKQCDTYLIFISNMVSRFIYINIALVYAFHLAYENMKSL